MECTGLLYLHSYWSCHLLTATDFIIRNDINTVFPDILLILLEVSSGIVGIWRADVFIDHEGAYIVFIHFFSCLIALTKMPCNLSRNIYLMLTANT